jgi:hypothetical protein
LLDSYKGGQAYVDKNYLFQHSLETNNDYTRRKERAFFISHVREIIDILIGYLFNYEIKREIPEEINYIYDNIDRSKSYSSFIQSAAVHSCLYTNAILVDAPLFNEDEVVSLADREALNLRPYAKRYPIFDIRDFSYDENGKLEWMLLDDSYMDSSNPFSKSKEIILYSLWQKETVTRFYYYRDEKDKNEIKFLKEETFTHGLGEVPIVLVAFRDIEDDKFSDSFAENLALLDKVMFNYFSLLDVTLSKNAIKTLIFPSQNNELPKSLKDASKLSQMLAIPFDSNSSNKPFLLEPQNSDTDGYINVINVLLSEARASVGLTKDATVHGISGKAKEKELERVNVILRQGSVSLENMEKEIIRLFLKWEQKEDLPYNITYPTKFHSEETEEILQRLYDTLTLPSATLQEESVKDIVEIVHPNLEQEKVDTIAVEIKESEESIGAVTNEESTQQA